MIKRFLLIAAIIAFGCATFGISIGNLALIPCGLTLFAASFVDFK